MAMRARITSAVFALIAGLAAFTAHAIEDLRPPNDDFDDALELSSAVPFHRVFIDVGSKQPGEDDFPFLNPQNMPWLTAGQSIWFKWTAPEDGLSILSLDETTFYPAVAVFEGGTYASRTAVAAVETPLANQPPGQVFFPQPTLDFRGQMRWLFPARRGVTYRIGVDGVVSVTEPVFDLIGVVQVQVHFQPKPANDDFADADPIPNSAVRLEGTFAGASAEPGEPISGRGIPYSTAELHAANFIPSASGRTLWYSWKAPASGMLTIGSAETNSQAVVTVFRGDALANLSAVKTNLSLWRYVSGLASDEYNWLRIKPQIFLSVLAGDEFKIQVDTLKPIYTGAFAFNLSFTPAPPNDDFLNPALLSGSSLAVTNSNLGATLDPGETLGGDFGASVWYRWRAPGTGSLTLTTNDPVVFPPPSSINHPSVFDPGSGGGVIIVGPGQGAWIEVDPDVFAPHFAIYSGSSLAALTPLAAGSWAAARVEAGAEYAIAMRSARGLPGAFKLSLAFNELPPNDDFRAAIPLQGPSLTVKGYLTAASAEPGEPPHAGSPAVHSVWWTWTPAATGPARLHSFSPRLRFAVYAGNAFEQLAVQASGWSTTTTTLASNYAELWFEAVRGQSYRIAVDSGPDLPGSVEFDLDLVPPQINVDRPVSGSYRMFKIVERRDAGITIRLDHSTNLAQWTPLLTNLLRSDVTYFYCPVGLAEPAGFFRTVPLGQ